MTTPFLPLGDTASGRAKKNAAVSWLWVHIYCTKTLHTCGFDFTVTLSVMTMTKKTVTFQMLSFGSVHSSQGHSSNAGWVHAYWSSFLSPFPSLPCPKISFTLHSPLLNTELNGNSSSGLLLLINLFIYLFSGKDLAEPTIVILRKLQMRCTHWDHITLAASWFPSFLNMEERAAPLGRAVLQYYSRTLLSRLSIGTAPPDLSMISLTPNSLN